MQTLVVATLPAAIADTDKAGDLTLRRLDDGQHLVVVLEKQETPLLSATKHPRPHRRLHQLQRLAMAPKIFRDPLPKPLSPLPRPRPAIRKNKHTRLQPHHQPQHPLPAARVKAQPQPAVAKTMQQEIRVECKHLGGSGWRPGGYMLAIASKVDEVTTPCSLCYYKRTESSG